MRLIEQQMNNAIRCNKNFSKGNTVVINIGTKSFVYLHGNHIATVGSDFLQIFDGGWQSVTTKSRLNALLDELKPGFGIFQKNWVWYLSDRLNDMIHPFQSGGIIAGALS